MFSFYLESCSEIKKRWSGFQDDEYMIKMGSSCQPVRMFCYGMQTAKPLEYLTLEAGSDRNFATFFRERLLNYESCSGKTNPQPKLTAKYWGTTRYGYQGELVHFFLRKLPWGTELIIVIVTPNRSKNIMGNLENRCKITTKTLLI